jgi:hypothetical protein
MILPETFHQIESCVDSVGVDIAGFKQAINSEIASSFLTLKEQF